MTELWHYVSSCSWTCRPLFGTDCNHGNDYYSSHTVSYRGCTDWEYNFSVILPFGLGGSLCILGTAYTDDFNRDVFWELSPATTMRIMTTPPQTYRNMMWSNTYSLCTDQNTFGAVQVGCSICKSSYLIKAARPGGMRTHSQVNG